MLTRLTRGLVAVGLTLTIAACATAPAADIAPPPMKQTDASRGKVDHRGNFAAFFVGVVIEDQRNPAGVDHPRSLPLLCIRRRNGVTERADDFRKLLCR